MSPQRRRNKRRRLRTRQQARRTGHRARAYLRQLEWDRVERLRDLLVALGLLGHRLGAAVIPPNKSSVGPQHAARGVATCRAGHEWPALQHILGAPQGGICSPKTCPVCHRQVKFGGFTANPERFEFLTRQTINEWIR